MAWWGWIVIGALLLAAESLLSTDFFLVFFGAAGIILGLLGLAGLHLPVWAQWLLFSVLSIVSLVVFRGRLRRAWHKEGSHLPDTDLIGDVAVARERVPVGGLGQGEMRGSVWRIRNAGSQDLAPGDRCRVEQVEGLTLSVRKES